MKRSRAVAIILAFAALLASAAAQNQPQSASAGAGDKLDAYIESLRANARTEKIEIISQAMQFNSSESAAFWPVYRNYEQDLKKLNDEKLALLKDYALNIDNISTAKAKEMTDKSFVLEEKRTALKRKYCKELEKILPANRVARFFQVDNRIELLVGLQIASEVPLMD